MKRNLLLGLLCLPGLLPAQTTVKGIVTEQNSGNKPIPAVQIKALGTEPELSDNAGQFQLIFTNKVPGDRIIVSEISKKGYEIVNKDIVNNWVITNNTNEKTKIIMCTEGTIAQNTLKYYNISLSGLTRSYQDKIKQLQEQKDKAILDTKTYGEQAKTLTEQFDNQQKQLETLADKFARENFDDCSGIHKQAFEAFKSGNIEEAIRILETVNSEEEILKAKKQKNKAENMISQSDKIIKQNIIKLMFQADLYASELRFEDAEKTYKIAINADSTDFDNVYTFAKYFYNHAEIEKSIKWNEIALALAPNDINKSEVLQNLGVLLKNTNHFDTSEVKISEALRIRRKLAESDPKVYNPILASTLVSLAEIQICKDKFEESEVNMKEALNKYRKLDMKDPEIKNEIASILSNYVDILYVNNQFDRANIYLTEAEKLYTELISINYKEKINHWSWNPCTRLAFVQVRLGELDKAAVNFEISLELFRKLAVQNPLLYNYKIATVLDGLADIQLKLKQLDKAENNALESVKIYRELISLQPWADLNLGRSLFTLTQIVCLKRAFDRSEKYFNEGVNIYKEHNKDNSNINDYNISVFYYTFSLTNLEANNYENAEKYFNEASDLFLSLIKLKPVYKSTVAFYFSAYSYNLIKYKHFEKAEIIARKSVEIDNNIIWGDANLAIALLFNGKYNEAKKIYLELKNKVHPLDKAKTYKNAFLEDLEEMEKAGVTHPDVAKIRALLIN